MEKIVLDIEKDLRPYQEIGRDFAYEGRRRIIGDPMGIGKSVQALATLHAIGADRALIIVGPTIAAEVWRREAAKWMPWAKTYEFLGPKVIREKELDKWHAEKKGAVKVKLMVTNYHNIKNLPWKKWPYIIADEAHRVRNRKIDWHKNLKKLEAGRLTFLTGSPMVNHPADILPLIMILKKELPYYRSYWRLLGRWFAITDGFHGKSIDLCKDPKGFRRWCKRVMIRRSKKKALPGLPPKVRLPFFVDMKPKQRRLYNDLAENLFAELPGGNFIATPSVMTLLLRLRQVLITPKLIGDFETPSAAFETMIEWADECKRTNKQAVIFTPFAKAIPHVQEYLLKRLRVKSINIQGGMSVDDFRKKLAYYEDGKAQVAVVSIKVAESYSLCNASRALFLGADWNPQVNEQAEDRLHRDGQKDVVVNCHYIVHKGTADEKVIAALEEKRSLVLQSLNAKSFIFSL